MRYLIALYTPAVRVLGIRALLLVVMSVPVAAQLNGPDPALNTRDVSVDAAYVRPFQSQRAIAAFGLDMAHATSFLFDLQNHERIGRGWRLYSWIALADFVLWSPYFHALHEFGHAGRFDAADGEDVVVRHIDGETEYTNFFPYFGASIFVREGGYASATHLSQDAPVDWSAVITAGGVNAEMYMTEVLEHRLYTRGGHVTYLGPYIRGKLSTLGYILALRDRTLEIEGREVQGDIDELLDYYAGRGYEVSEGELIAASVASLLASQSFYALVAASVDYADRPYEPGDTRARSIELAGFKLPDTGLYLTRSGPSARVTVGYRIGNLVVPVSVEHVYEGDRRTDVSAGFWYPLFIGDTVIAASANGVTAADGAAGGEATLTATTGWGLHLETGIGAYHRDTLYGRRHTPDATEEIGVELWGAVGFRY